MGKIREVGKTTKIRKMQHAHDVKDAASGEEAEDAGMHKMRTPGGCGTC
jgi:hypothetical protein